ncbi:MAG: Trm112 family protein [Hyphomicrobium sp.]|jgi:uncharacterized protein YbaR (Trm112 family)|nr:Trm112 family protein [Hyphomicrobium sp.]
MTAEDPKSRATSGPQLDPRLLEVLVCPLTKCTLVYRAEKQELFSRKAGLAFPIRNGVPLMTVEAARQLSDEEIAML